MKRIGPAAAAMATVVGILATGCSSGPNEVPHDWISEEYTMTADGYVDRDDPPSKVADEIHGHTAAAERLTSGDMVFLRYADDIVAIIPRGSDPDTGSDYDYGYDTGTDSGSGSDSGYDTGTDVGSGSESESGSVIEVEDYEEGYDRYRSYVGGWWPAPGSHKFRGGGPGSGK